MKISAVVGMNYGDEGKGHIVNFLSDANTLNVKFNGGAQAGHGVVVADGREHIFHHFGAGTLRGARTLFGPHFIVNPLLFLKELDELMKLKAPVREVFIDPLCRVSTPYDMLLNEYSSRQKGTNLTCGVGINETVERSLYKQLRILARDLLDKSAAQLGGVLSRIENEYLPFRLKELGVDPDGFKRYAVERLGNFTLVDKFLDYAKWMMEHSVLWGTEDLIERYHAKAPGRKIVFEGGQGMLLDQSRKEYMPYLTRSSTGMKNVMEVLSGLRSKVELDVYLVTRAYLSRHGQGPMMNETSVLPYSAVADPTNPENPYQGKMRYGYLDLRWYDKALKETQATLGQYTFPAKRAPRVGVALTCVDHLDTYQGQPFVAKITHQENGAEKASVVAAMPSLMLVSAGRTEKDVITVQRIGAHT